MALPGRSRFDKVRRLRKRVEFLAVQERGQRRHGRLMVVLACRAPEGTPSRIGITVTRRVGSAVVRNRIKRMIREAFRTRQAEVPPWLDIVVVARREAVGASSLEIGQELIGAIHSLSRTLDKRRP